MAPFINNRISLFPKAFLGPTIAFCCGLISCTGSFEIPPATTDTDIPSNNSDCSLTINPGDSFIEAFSSLKSGDTLCLNDGLYQQAMDVPSNINVRAINDGKAEIDGGSTLGEEWTGGLAAIPVSVVYRHTTQFERQIPAT